MCIMQGFGAHSTEECRMLRRQNAQTLIMGRFTPFQSNSRAPRSRGQATPSEPPCELCKKVCFTK